MSKKAEPACLAPAVDAANLADDAWEPRLVAAEGAELPFSGVTNGSLSGEFRGTAFRVGVDRGRAILDGRGFRIRPDRGRITLNLGVRD